MTDSKINLEQAHVLRSSDALVEFLDLLELEFCSCTSNEHVTVFHLQILNITVYEFNVRSHRYFVTNPCPNVDYIINNNKMSLRYF